MQSAPECDRLSVNSLCYTYSQERRTVFVLHLVEFVLSECGNGAGLSASAEYDVSPPPSEPNRSKQRARR